MTIQDSYVRVSRVGERQGETFISPRVQRQRVEDYARLHQHTIGRHFEELDESGRRADRPLLEEAIARQERGEAQVLCVAKLDRLSRDLQDGLAAIRRVTDAGGSFVAVEDGLDSGSASGKLTIRLLLSVAEWQLDRTRSNWGDAQERAIARGVFLGSLPLGYRRRPSGQLAIDPAMAPVARELFRRRLAGATPTQLAAWLTEQGIPTPTGGSRWSYGTVKSLLGRRAYLGESWHAAFSNTAAHEAMIDAATWQAAQVKPGGGSGPRSAQPALLRGLLRCASCGRVMSTLLDESQRLTYSCPRHSTAGSCPRPARILDALVEPFAEAAMLGQLKGQGAGRTRAAVKWAEADASQAARQLIAYRDHPSLLDTLGPDRFQAGLAKRRTREERALEEVARARTYAAQMQPGPVELRRRWPSLDLDAKHKLIAGHLDCLFVFPGHGRERLWAIPTGQLPEGMPPRAPRSTAELRAFEPEPDQPKAPPAPGCLDWSRLKVTRTLAPFMAGREQFPPFAEFQAAGQALAHANAQRLRPMRKWAQHFDIRPSASVCSAPGWTDARVRQQLAVALEGWERWPTRREFAELTLSELRTAAQFHGGAAYWAREMGLPMRSQRPPRTVWTRAAMQRAVGELAGHQPRWPTRRQFTEAGLSGLYSQLLRSGARLQIADDLGLAISTDGSHRSPSRWTDQAVSQALDGLLAGRERYPTYRQWQARSLGGLHQKISRSPGGHAAVAKRYGLARRRG